MAKTEIELDLTPLPFVDFTLVCPLCACVLTGDAVVKEHPKLMMVTGWGKYREAPKTMQCQNVGKRYTVTNNSALQVKQL
jgi:hypothetical protein